MFRFVSADRRSRNQAFDLPRKIEEGLRVPQVRRIHLILSLEKVRHIRRNPAA